MCDYSIDSWRVPLTGASPALFDSGYDCHKNKLSIFDLHKTVSSEHNNEIL